MTRYALMLVSFDGAHSSVLWHTVSESRVVGLKWCQHLGRGSGSARRVDGDEVAGNRIENGHGAPHPGSDAADGKNFSSA